MEEPISIPGKLASWSGASDSSQTSGKGYGMKMRKMLLGVGCVLALGVAGCTTAGPFVTNISSDGNGGLVIEKSYVQMNSFMGTVSNKDQSTTHIKLTELRR